jgi:SAM-dependent methyltransferase
LRTGGEQIVAEAELFHPRRFRTAAPHYLEGRPGYSPRLIFHVAQAIGLGPNGRVLDLGCGPGMLAGAFASLGNTVVAMDPEPEMLRIAQEVFGGDGRISFASGSSIDLSPALGCFHLVTMGRSFHWMDRAETLRRLDRLIEAGGAVALFNSEHCDVPDNAWLADYRALVRGYAAGDLGHARRVAGWVRHEALLLDSAFSVLDDIAVIEQRDVSVAQLIHRAFSRSSTAPDRLGSDAPRLATEIEALLYPIARDGVLTEVIATNALIGRREGEDSRQ